MKFVHKSGALLLAALLFLGTVSVCAQDTLPRLMEDVQTYLMGQEENEYSTNADWERFALARSGAAVRSETKKNYAKLMGQYLNKQTAEKGSMAYATDYARMALTAGAMGYDPQRFAGIDLIETLSKSELADKQGINGYLYSLLALDSSDYKLPEAAKWTSEKLVETICSLQKEKGYFVFADSFGADVDLTAAAVTALAPHSAAEPAKTAVERALEWLSGAQLPSGGYAAMGKENSMSGAQVLTALCAAGIDPLKDKRFIKQGNSVMDQLSGYAMADGGFKFQREDTQSNQMATAQVLYALSALERQQNGKTALFDLRDVTGTIPLELDAGEELPGKEPNETDFSEPVGETTVAVSANNVDRGVPEKPITTGLYGNDTPYSLLQQIMGKENVETTGSGTSIYVSGIKCGDEWVREFDYGPQSGWKYSVNGEFLSQSAGAYPVKDGDVVYWFYVTGQETDVTDASAFENLPLTVDEMRIAGWSVLSMGRKPETLSDWEMVILSMSGSPVSALSLNQRVREAEGEWRKITDLERTALAAAAIGKDPRSIEGYNLIEKIVTSDRMLSQGANGPIYALITLDSKGFEVPEGAVWTRDKLVETVLSFQNADGSFALTQGGDSNVDVTAMALQALSGYLQQEQVKQAADRALVFLSQAQDEDGGYSLYGEANCESCAQVVLALQTLGIDPQNDERFVKNGTSVLDALMTYARDENAEFGHTKTGEADSIATEQGLLAVSALHKKTRWFDFGKAGEAPETSTIADLDSASDWARVSIEKAVKLGIIKGYGDGTFAPRQYITRAEFLSLMVRMLDYQLIEGDPLALPPSVYPDVTESDWFYQELAVAASHGLVYPSERENFRPDDPLTREEMANILLRTYMFPRADSADLKDDKLIASWAKTGVYTVYQAGIMQGDQGYFDPQGKVTREMVAVVGMRLHGE